MTMIGTMKNMDVTMAGLAAIAALTGAPQPPQIYWGRPSQNKYAGKCKAMASKKPRHIHLTEFMRDWTPRY
jgi:hypothetical protein